MIRIIPTYEWCQSQGNTSRLLGLFKSLSLLQMVYLISIAHLVTFTNYVLSKSNDLISY